MKPTPNGWPRLSIGLHCKNASAHIAWLEKAFGFETRLRIDGEGGRIEHSELVYGDALIMLGEEAAKGRVSEISPQSIDGKNTMTAMIFVDDADAHCAHVRAAGGEITYEPKTSDYGEAYWSDRSYQVRDPEGFLWWFVQRIR